ncbi:sentrin-specific protease 8 [Anaeramoeba ignava]|uniref:Sentrin-specific protease 8 n=1 Tax=Anaeramoeba ignava TaxID=1746090 RepID=A0A9Q0LB48_ANAIG|nr:sentrin-specific protease 8 [Anaeramoeba ignava]
MSLEPVLNYYTISLYQEHVDTLTGNYWIEDAIITFYFEYLTHNKIKDDKLLLLNPTMMMFISFITSKEELEEALKERKLTEREIICFPITDTQSLEQIGGSHWSLLVFVKKLNTFYYYDSMYTYNFHSAQNFLNKFKPLLIEKEKLKETKIIQVKTKSQENSYDCGLYLLSFANYIQNHFYSENEKSLNFLSDSKLINKEINENSVIELRSNILNLITSLAKEKKTY